MSTRAPIAVTLGDPCGIGPEVTAAAWRVLRAEFAMVAIGDPEVMAATGTPIREIATPDGLSGASGDCLPLIPVRLSARAVPGKPDPAHAGAVIASIEAGTKLVLSGAASALCTAPISKEVLLAGGGFAFPGHTEFLGALCEVERPVMMLAGPELRVVPVTIHIGLAEVKEALTVGLLEETIRVTHHALIRDFGIHRPRIAVAGLNPHAGENGHIGREEITLIRPVLERLRDDGLEIRGPLSADTMFHAAARARYDVAICMYHDQALIPIKTLAFDTGVNVTLGLPIIRTSPDHGTAFDIAGQGQADPASMVAALRMADSLARQRAHARIADRCG